MNSQEPSYSWPKNSEHLKKIEIINSQNKSISQEPSYSWP